MNFDLANTSLPHGVTVLEASAGTGKTYALAGIYLRLVVEHALAPKQILVTTYTEAATAELRGRIRKRLENAEQVFSGEAPNPDDTLLPALLARVERNVALARISAALRSFDEAAIHTIHGFCERTLSERAFESGSTFDTELLPDQSELLREVAADFWRRETYGDDPVAAALTLASGIYVDALAAMLPRVLSNPRITILPDEDDIASLHTHARELIGTFASSWPAWREQVRAFFLMDSGNAWANKPARAEATEPLLDALDTLPASLEAPAAAYEALAHFTNHWLGENSSKKSKLGPPKHPFFDLATDFAALLKNHGPAARANFLRWARGEVASRKAARALRSFDDLLRHLDVALPSPGGGALGDAIRSRFHAALVDEFQDTDAVQDAIFSKLFGAGDTWLFLIGDPKQAIYGFRGADVFTYIAATQRTPEEHRHDLGTNHRSAKQLVVAVNELFSTHPLPFAEKRIAFHQVAAAGRADSKPLRVNGAARAPMRLWLWDEDKPIATGRANAELPAIVAAEIRRLLDSATLDEKPLRPCDCAVLTFTNAQARAMQAALAAINIPAVLMSNASVFDSREAVQLRILLAALAEPWREDKVRAALLTDFFAVAATHSSQNVSATPRRVSHSAAAQMQNDKTRGDGSADTTCDEGVAATAFPVAHARWRERGFIVMFREFLRALRVRETLLARPGGERALTNLLQLSELLQDAADSQRLGPAGVVRWLGQQISAKRKSDEHELRLERDDEAVHVVTVHKSKGLEYPVVFCPFAWQNAERRKDEAPLYHDDDGSLVLDLAAPDDGPQMRRMINERLAEHVRLLYVALTRAKHECHVVVGEFNKCATSSLLWLLDPPTAPGGDPAESLKAMKHELAARVGKLALERPECFSIGPLPSPATTMWRAPGGGDAPQGAREFTGNIEHSWGVISFSGIVRDAESEGADHDAAPSPEPGVELRGIHALPRGKRTGICIHEIFEHLDFTSDASIEPLVGRTLRKHGLHTPERAAALAENVRRTLAHPAAALASCPPARTLRELEFHLPAKLLTPAQLTAFAGAGLAFEPRRGILKGYMDLVFERDGRFHILDWKSNWLGADAGDYTAETMAAEMTRHRYGLQWRLYLVALHRFLRSRMRDYDPARHLGEIYYVFLRGLDPVRPELGIVREMPDLAELERMDSLFSTP